MMANRPDFIIVGAMKSATTTLHEQLARQRGLFMSRPKEPNFFSDDSVYDRGIAWYSSLFESSIEGSLRGESSTHYSKLPTFPRTVERMSQALPRVRIVYVMRHPIDRLISHHVHERSLETVPESIEDAIVAKPEMVDYGLYHMQLRPYLDAFGPENVLPVFFGRLVLRPQDALERICQFIGYQGRAHWDTSLRPQNVGSERLRKSALREVLVNTPSFAAIRRRLTPRLLAEQLKSLWRVKGERTRIQPEFYDRLRDRFDPDLERLGADLGIELRCDNFSEITEASDYTWVDRGRKRERAVLNKDPIVRQATEARNENCTR